MRILFYTDQPMLALGLAGFLKENLTKDLETCLKLHELFARAEANPADILLLDMAPHIGFRELHAFAEKFPRTKIVLWCNEISTDMAFNALGFGVKGVLIKNRPAEEVVRCITAIHSGQLWFEKDLTDRLLTAQRIALTRRESQLVALLARGSKNKEMAKALGISEGTVKVYLSRLFKKVGAKDRFELGLWGREQLGPNTSALGAEILLPRSLAVSSSPSKDRAPSRSYAPPRSNGFVRRPHKQTNHEDAAEPCKIVAERLAAFLTDTIRDEGNAEAEGSATIPKMSPKEIAQALGARQPSVNRCLDILRTAGFIAVSRKTFRIYNAGDLPAWIQDNAQLFADGNK